MSVAKKKQHPRQDKPASPINVSTHRLSKSRFCTGVQCHKALYLKIHEPELAEPVDPAQQMILDQGTQVGVEARTCIPGGVLIEINYLHPQEAIKATQETIAQNPPAIFEAACYFHNTLVRIDILKNNGDGTWDIIEQNFPRNIMLRSSEVLLGYGLAVFFDSPQAFFRSFSSSV